MKTCDARSTHEAYREFVATIDRFTNGTAKRHSRGAGWLYTGLLLDAKGTEEVNDSSARTINGP